MYVKQQCKFFIEILKIRPNSCFLHLFCSKVITNSVHRQSFMDSDLDWGWGIPIPKKQEFGIIFNILRKKIAMLFTYIMHTIDAKNKLRDTVPTTAIALPVNTMPPI